ncbi:hypothetical protein AB6A23_15010 [Paenibacillus tarimensis]
MKIKWVPAILAVIAASGLLFGSWYGYKYIVLEQPFEKIVNQLDGIKAAKPVFENNRVTVELQLADGAEIRDIYRQMRTEGASVIGNRELQLVIRESSNDHLDRLWSSMLFEVAQAMETREYSNIPEAMKKLEQENEGLKVVTEMDDINVYITMNDGKSTKYIVLPRIPLKLGVWPNA